MFIKNLYNKDIRLWLAGTKTINTLADAFRLAHHSLLKLKKYEGLAYNDEHTITEINEIIYSTTNIKQAIDQRLQTKTHKMKLTKIIHFAATAGSVKNSATQQKSVKITQLWPIKIKYIKVQPTHK